MSYYEALGLKKEPFSTSPDPAFFYRSNAHNTALERLEIMIRLKRGLSLILGDVGIGKTTMSRALLQNFTSDDNYIFHIILDPSYKSEFQFLSSLARMFGIKPNTRSTLDYRDEIQKYLYKKGVEERKTVVLLIDEGQKLSTPFLEILRTLLNYETNEYKLLQLVVISQMEVLPRLKKIRNFYDRIGMKYIINPLDEKETKEMIEFRLKEAGMGPSGRLFTDEAVRLIFEYAQGYPRKISIACHNALESIVMSDRALVDGTVMSDVIKRELI
jgi:general secretion pathway protein A